MTVRPPAKNPCGSCPYRKDVPAGVWAEEEYAKLERFDGETAQQDPSIFLCHQQNGRVCGGWAGCHSMEDSLGLRFAVLTGNVTPDDADAIVGYDSPVPLFSSGSEAAAHGRSGIESPDDAAVKVIDKLERKRNQ